MANQPFKIIRNSEKQLPCNVEAEQALIGSILVSNDKTPWLFLTLFNEQLNVNKSINNIIYFI